MIAPARQAAYTILRAVSTNTSDLPSAIARARRGLTDDRDRALAAEIATGVERWRAALDHVIAHFARRSLDRLDDEIVEILRLSAYQLLHLTRVPAAAVVDDAVDLAKRAGKKSASGFVNGVLRSLSRQRNALPLPPPDQVLDYLSITLSHPRWLAQRWLARFGFDATESWLRFNNAASPLTLRVNRLRASRDELQQHLLDADIRATPGPYAPDALRVDPGQSIRLPADGAFVIQDEASQLVTLLAGPSPGRRVLDACASPGGKATALAAALGTGDLLVACDVRDRRMDLLRRTVAATGAQRVALVQADLLAPLPFSRPFDCVFVDAPCSGLGTLRRDPDLKWRRREDDLVELARAQRQMLTHAAAAVAPGGRLIYATCSSEPEENEQVADEFLRTHHDFEPVHAASVHPLLPSSVVDASGDLRTTPHEHGLEAFYGRVMKRRAQG